MTTLKMNTKRFSADQTIPNSYCNSNPNVHSTPSPNAYPNKVYTVCAASPPLLADKHSCFNLVLLLVESMVKVFLSHNHLVLSRSSFHTITSC